MNDEILQLYPQPTTKHALKGLYLGHKLRQSNKSNKGVPFVYSNYVTSIDGRIAVPRENGSGMSVPRQIANDRDWRLFQELAVQADMIITSGRYLRDYAAGTAQEILRVYDDPDLADLKEWRAAHSLSPQPDLAVVSATLEFPLPDALTTGGRNVVIFTVENAPSNRVRLLEEHAGRVIMVGSDRVEGALLIAAMAELGYRLVYNATGPKVMHLLLADNLVDRLYLTHANRLLGGDPYSTIVEGPLLEPPVNLKLKSIYLDQTGLDGLGQLFTCYDRAQ